MLDRKYLRDVLLPENLTKESIFLAMKDTQNFFKTINSKTGIKLSQLIQKNNFSGVVSNLFTHYMGEHSLYKPYSDQEYPDLMYAEKNIGLEVKACINYKKGGESHNGHTGWHIIVCYTILDDGNIEFIQALIANINGYEMGEGISDWVYCKSKRNSNNSQRTETYVTNSIGTNKLRDGAVYINTDIIQYSKQLKSARNKLKDILPVPPYSPFFE